MDYEKMNKELMEQLKALPEDQRELVMEEVYKNVIETLDKPFVFTTNEPLTSNGFTKESFLKLVDHINNMQPPEHYFEIMADRKTILSLDSTNPLILELQEELKNNPIGSLLLLHDSLGYAYLNELVKRILE